VRFAAQQSTKNACLPTKFLAGAAKPHTDLERFTPAASPVAPRPCHEDTKQRKESLMGLLGKLLKSDSKKSSGSGNAQTHLANGRKLLASRFYDRASVEFNKAIQLDSKGTLPTVTQLFLDAEAAGEGAEILSLGQNLLQAHPENAELANLLGTLYRRQNEHRKAENFYRHALKADAQHKLASYNLAATLAHCEVYDEGAVDALASLEELKNFVIPPFEKELEELCKMELARKQAEFDAEQAAKAAEGEEPEDPEAIAAARPKDPPAYPQEPEKLANQIRQIWFDAKTAEDKADPFRLMCGLAYHLLEARRPISYKIFEWAVPRDPMNQTLRCFQFVALGLRKPELAIEKLVSFLGKNPYHRYALVNLGLLYRDAKQPQQARRYLFMAYELLRRSQGEYDTQPMITEAFRLLGTANKKKGFGMLKEMYQELEKPAQLLQIGELGVELKELDISQDCFEMVLKLKPGEEKAQQGLDQVRALHLNNAKAKAAKEKWEEAMESYERALKLDVTVDDLTGAIEVADQLEDEHKAQLLRKQLEIASQEEVLRESDELVSQALKQDKAGKARAALESFQQALLIAPRHKVFVQMLDCCQRNQMEEQAAALSVWFEKVQEADRESLPEMLQV
jgi:tetratricopeptide (TPR) repeat protein